MNEKKTSERVRELEDQVVRLTAMNDRYVLTIDRLQMRIQNMNGERWTLIR